MILSRTSEYAVRATLFVARQPATALIRVADVAAALDIPRNYLSKILHVLGRAGILTSARGRTGGFRLARSTRDVTLLDIVTEFDDITASRRCLLGFPMCNDRTPCPAHGRWKETSQAVAKFFNETTIADLLQGTPVRKDAA